MLTLVYNQGILSGYINNTVACYGNFPVIQFGTNAAVGKHWWRGNETSNRLVGKVDNVRVYNRALTPSEIQALYHEGGWPIIQPIEMVNVQGGTFQMGETGIAEPVHTVTVSSFQLGKSEITQVQWQEVMGSNPSYFQVIPIDLWSRLPGWTVFISAMHLA